GFPGWRSGRVCTGAGRASQCATAVAGACGLRKRSNGCLELTDEPSGSDQYPSSAEGKSALLHDAPLTDEQEDRGCEHLRQRVESLVIGLVVIGDEPAERAEHHCS